MSATPKARRSQLVSTYGVGGLFPSDNTSFMIAGLQDWNRERTEPASEPRLARSLGVTELPDASGRRDQGRPRRAFPPAAHVPGLSTDPTTARAGFTLG